MNRFILHLIAIFVFVLIMGTPVALAQPESGPPVKTKSLGVANQQSVDVAEQYIKQKLGEDYYNQFISFESGNSYEDCLENNCRVRNEISFSYKIPFEANDDPKSGPPPKRIYITIDNKGTIVNYRGPSKPYKFLISKNEAITKAKSYGLKSIIDVAIVKTSEPDGYEIVWAVSSNDLVGECRDIGVIKECIYKGIYVDVDTGKIRGEYGINPLVLSPVGIGNVRLGEFFQSQNTSTSFDIKILAFTIIIALITVFFLRFR